MGRHSSLAAISCDTVPLLSIMLRLQTAQVPQQQDYSEAVNRAHIRGLPINLSSTTTTTTPSAAAANVNR